MTVPIAHRKTCNLNGRGNVNTDMLRDVMIVDLHPNTRIKMFIGWSSDRYGAPLGTSMKIFSGDLVITS